MTLTISSINIWALLVCIVLNMGLGALWYSPLLFGNLWLRLIGKKAEEIGREESGKAMGLAFIPAVISIGLLALLLQFCRTETIGDALVIGTVVSAGFIGMSAFNLVLFEDRKPALAVLNTGYFFVSLNIASIILTLWR